MNDDTVFPPDREKKFWVNVSTEHTDVRCALYAVASMWVYFYRMFTIK